jgi:anti-anti-sigma regulatory factor
MFLRGDGKMARRCELRVARTGTGFVVRVQGSGTSANSPTLADFVTGCFQQQPDACVAVDLLGCGYLDSTFLGCLLNLQRAGSETRFQVVADGAARDRLLTATQLDSYLTLVSEAPNSVSTFRTIDAKSLSQREQGKHIMESHLALSEVPSDAASTFGQIAARLKIELEQQDRDDPSQTDTVVFPTRRRR